ncbi:hydroxypyruvate isomerase family protein [Tautonia sociabilis]|uniref:Xylose isomerase n=1 Tax=Tautonia sociabilis TaxID=2080755 RepID=A0A432MN81_9BACT|nr:TIM barrel protein [Tautonia sociabilis]RUL88528.1 xylose isomerase [Tautonia sociabilis]
MSLNRRDFVAAGLAAGASLGASATASSFSAPHPRHDASGDVPHRDFRLKYAPHFGMFRNHAPGGPLDELKFIKDVGFRAVEDNGMMRRPVQEQESIAREMDRLGLEMGVFVATASFEEPTFASGNPDFAEKVLADITQAVETAKRVNAKWTTVVPGIFDHRLPLDYQTVNVIELLKRCCDLCAPSGLVMVLEPLNHYANHPELFLWQIPQAYLICKAVGHPSCKILFDLYHQQISEGNIIPNIDAAWTEIAYFQTGDNPGRMEPTTGEMNYKNIFKHLHAKGFDGVVGMEHGNSKPGKEGEIALINAYIECDSF